MAGRKRRSRATGKPRGGGGSRNPNSLANLRNAPAAPAGNSRNLQHGGYAAVAAERLQAKALEVLEALSVDVPIADVRDAVALRLLAECLCRLDSVAAHIALFGAFHEDSREPKAVLGVERQLRLEAAGHAEALGLTPRSRVALGLDVLAGVNIERRAIQDAGRREQLEYLLGPAGAAKGLEGAAGRADKRVRPAAGMTPRMAEQEAQALAAAMTDDELDDYLASRGIVDGAGEDRERVRAAIERRRRRSDAASDADPDGGED